MKSRHDKANIHVTALTNYSCTHLFAEQRKQVITALHDGLVTSRTRQSAGKLTINNIMEIKSDSALTSFFMACTEHSPEHWWSMHYYGWPSSISDISIYCCINLSKWRYHFTQQLIYWGHWRKHVWKCSTLCRERLFIPYPTHLKYANLSQHCLLRLWKCDDMRGIVIQ